MDKRSLIERSESHNNNILCAEVQQEETVGGLYRPVAIRDRRYRKVKVLKKLDEQVLEGDILYIPINSGTQIEDDGIIYTIVNKRDILMLDRHADKEDIPTK